MGLGGSWPRYCTAASRLPHLFHLMTHVGVPRFCYLLVVQDGACWTRPEVCGPGVPLPLGCAGVEGAHTHLLPIFPLRLPSHFLCLFLPENFLLPDVSWQWLWLAGWWRWMNLPCVPMSGDVVMVVVYSGVLQVNRLG